MARTDRRRVVVTGVGLVSPLGVGTRETWEAVPLLARPAAPLPTIETAPETGRPVVRNESGVIVGAASQGAESKIVGFIPLASRARPQQVIITDASEEQQRGRATVRKQREERAQAQGRRRKMTVRNMRGRGGPMATRVTTQEMSDAQKRTHVGEVIQIAEMAHQMGKKATAVLRVLWGMGMRGLTLNNVIDADTAELVASEFGYTIDNVAFQEDQYLDEKEEGDGVWRATVVRIMGERRGGGLPFCSLRLSYSFRLRHLGCFGREPVSKTENSP